MASERSEPAASLPRADSSSASLAGMRRVLNFENGRPSSLGVVRRDGLQLVNISYFSDDRQRGNALMHDRRIRVVKRLQGDEAQLCREPRAPFLNLSHPQPICREIERTIKANGRGPKPVIGVFEEGIQIRRPANAAALCCGVL